MAGYEVGPTLKQGARPWPNQWHNSVVVKVCNHPKWESVLLAPTGEVPLEEVVRCTRCHAPRCGSSRDADPCMRVRHHTIHHTFLSGKIEPVGGYKCSLAGCTCAPARKPARKAPSM